MAAGRFLSRARNMKSELKIVTFAMMNKSQLEKEIIKALEINSRVDWLTVDPNQEFKDLIKFVKQLFKEYNGK
jgi:hypothetical protein